MEKLFSYTIQIVKDTIDFFVDIFYFYTKECIFLCILLLSIFIGYNSTTNTILKNYILYSNLLAENVTCIDGHYECIVTSNAGKFKLNLIDAKNIKHKKFDIGMYFGTCKNKIYLKVYNDDIIEPYNIIIVDTYSKKSSEYSFYNEKYKIHASKCE